MLTELLKDQQELEFRIHKIQKEIKMKIDIILAAANIEHGKINVVLKPLPELKIALRTIDRESRITFGKFTSVAEKLQKIFSVKFKGNLFFINHNVFSILINNPECLSNLQNLLDMDDEDLELFIKLQN